MHADVRLAGGVGRAPGGVAPCRRRDSQRSGGAVRRIAGRSSRRPLTRYNSAIVCMCIDDDRVAQSEEVHGQLEHVRLDTANVGVEKVAHEEDAKAAPRAIACAAIHAFLRSTIWY